MAGYWIPEKRRDYIAWFLKQGILTKFELSKMSDSELFRLYTEIRGKE